MLWFINYWKKSMTRSNLTKNNPNGKNIPNTSTLLLLMASVKEFALLLIIWTNKSTVKKWTKLNYFRSSLNLKERKALFMNQKLIKVKEAWEVFVTHFEDGSMKFSRSHTISLDLMLLHLVQAAEEPQATILLRPKPTFWSNFLCPELAQTYR